MNFAKAVLFFIATSVLGALAAVYVLGYSDLGLEAYDVYPSPDGRYQVEVLRRYWWGFIPMFAGQGSDAPGVARLVDRQGTILKEVKLPMVQEANDIVWKYGGVKIGILAEWYPRSIEAGRAQ